MKKLILLSILMIISLIGCKNGIFKPKTYYLNFEAGHWVSEENMFCDPYAYYGWSIEDKHDNYKYDESGKIVRETITGTATAQKGDWIWIYISVNDVFDNGYVSCESTDGSIFLYASTDNLFINESDYITAKSVIIDNVDTIIYVKSFKYQIPFDN